jgi:hypothetical protein
VWRNEGDSGDGIWQMDFIYLYEIEQKKPLAIALSGQCQLRGRDNGGKCN